MSRPYALPVAPTRLADNRTSIPPPEPRSRTDSPSWRSASAVGLPQPSEASTAPSGKPLVCEASYRLSVTGSQPHAPLGPQLPFSPPSTLIAASAYFSFTVSLICRSLIVAFRARGFNQSQHASSQLPACLPGFTDFVYAAICSSSHTQRSLCDSISTIWTRVSSERA